MKKIQGIEREPTGLESHIEETKNKLEAENNNFAELEANEYIERRRQALLLFRKLKLTSRGRKLVINSEIENSKDDIISLSNKNITRKRRYTQL